MAQSSKQEPFEPFEPFEFHVTPEFNEQYLFAAEDYHPRYLATDSGPPMVHPGLLLNQSNVTRSPSFSLRGWMAGIHAAEEVEFINPAKVGKRFKVTWKVLDEYEKRGRRYTVFEALIVDEDGLEILRRRTHGLLVKREEGG
jgi:acyl dehydratase